MINGIDAAVHIDFPFAQAVLAFDVEIKSGQLSLIASQTIYRRAQKVARYSRDELISKLARIGDPRRARERLIRIVRERPSDIFRWFDLARACEMDEQTRALMISHRLNRANVYLVRSVAYIEELAGPRLAMLSQELDRDDATSPVREAITDIIRWKTIVRCREDHAGSGGYFTVAERVISWQWENVIWPIIQECDFTSTLELGCGHGRNAEKLRRLAKSIDLIDVNESCLSACRARFGDTLDGCAFRYHKTTGNQLTGIPDCSITMLYCWDTMVHFDKIVVRDYLHEIVRVLAPGGRAFLHYSNIGAERPNSDLATNHGMRSDMSAELFARYAAEVGLRIISHRLSGKADGWGRDALDCLTLVERRR